MKITIFGTGYVGLVSGICFAELGNDVTCVDIDAEKIETLNKGIIPIYEPGLKELYEKTKERGLIHFTTDAATAIESGKVLFICVGTPQKQNGQADLSYVMAVASSIGKHMKEYKVIVDKSTVPVGTADKVAHAIKESQDTAVEFDVTSNPEFLKEGSAIKDFMEPDRIVVGADSERAQQVMLELYKPFVTEKAKVIFMDVKSAEITKYAANAMLATRISFMNELAPLCEEVGADIIKVARGIGTDTRIGPKFLQAGPGDGGSCFPKDIRALSHVLETHGQANTILKAVDAANERTKNRVVPRVKKMLGSLAKKRVAVWGLAFKPETDDMRESPAIPIIEQLQEEFATVVAYDPEAEETSKKVIKNVEYAADRYSCVEGADLLIIVTDWAEFKTANMEKVKSLLKGDFVFDGRNLFSPGKMKELGFRYESMGRKGV